MKSSELRAKLEALEREHGDMEVITEGCDCDGDSNDVVLYAGDFYITRASS